MGQKLLNFSKRSKTWFFRRIWLSVLEESLEVFLKFSKVADLLYNATEIIGFLKTFKISVFLQTKKMVF